MGRTSDSQETVNFETKPKTLTLPLLLMRRTVELTKQHACYSTRADYVKHAIYSFNDYTIKTVSSICGSYNGSDSEMRAIKLKISEKSFELYQIYHKCSAFYVEDNLTNNFVDYGEATNDQTIKIDGEIVKTLNSKMTISMPCGLLNLIRTLNDRFWKYASVDEYIRVALAWYIEQDIMMVKNMSSIYEVFGHDLRDVYLSCSFKKEE